MDNETKKYVSGAVLLVLIILAMFGLYNPTQIAADETATSDTAQSSTTVTVSPATPVQETVEPVVTAPVE